MVSQYMCGILVVCVMNKKLTICAGMKKSIYMCAIEFYFLFNVYTSNLWMEMFDGKEKAIGHRLPLK